jgi:hypothetical protein
MQPSTMGLNLSKDDLSCFTSKNEVRGSTRKMSITSHRRASRIAKNGLNVSSSFRNTANKAYAMKPGYVFDDDTVSTRDSRRVATEAVHKETSNSAGGIMGMFKRQSFASDHIHPRSTFRQDSAAFDPSSPMSDASEDTDMREASSSPLPIPTSPGPTSVSKPTLVDEDREVDHLRRVYDMRTWDMYIRITESRRHSNYQSQAPANSYACGSGVTMDHHSDPNAGCHSSSEYDEELMFHLE